jgi:hypothetical protein
VARTSGPTVATAVAAQGPLGHERERAHACDPSPAAGGPSSPAPGPSTPRSHRCRCGRAALCAHGHGGQVRACRVVRARARHACDTFASPAPSRARRLSRADARSSGEGAARPPLCADEAGESWSGRGHRGCTRRCLAGAGARVVRVRARHACDALVVISGAFINFLLHNHSIITIKY